MKSMRSIGGGLRIVLFNLYGYGCLTDAVSFVGPICGAINPSIASLTPFDAASMIALPLVWSACF